MLTKVESQKKEVEINTISISGNEVSGTISVVRFRDKDTRQIIHFAPALQLTGYGNDEAKSFEMLEFSINDFFSHLLSLSTQKRDAELTSLGFTLNKDAQNQFSNLAIDIHGELKSFNAVANNVELLTLIAD